MNQLQFWVFETPLDRDAQLPREQSRIKHAKTRLPIGECHSYELQFSLILAPENVSQRNSTHSIVFLRLLQIVLAVQQRSLRAEQRILYLCLLIFLSLIVHIISEFWWAFVSCCKAFWSQARCRNALESGINTKLSQKYIFAENQTTFWFFYWVALHTEEFFSKQALKTSHLT